MPKKIKLNLEDLKVQSFVTALSQAEQNKLRGGDSGIGFTDSCGLTCRCQDFQDPSAGDENSSVFPTLHLASNCTICHDGSVIHNTLTVPNCVS